MPVFIDEKFLKLKKNDEQYATDIFSGKDKPFSTNADFYCYCASLGKINNTKFETKKRAGIGEVKEGIFENRNLMGVIYTIALDERKDLNILKDKEECLKIFESYVNGGLSLVQKKSKDLSEEELFTHLMSDLREFALNNIPTEDEVTEGELDIE